MRETPLPTKKSLTCDITGTEAEILSQIRRYQKNAAVKSTAGSEQGDGDDFEVSPKDKLLTLWPHAMGTHFFQNGDPGGPNFQ